MKGKKVVIGVDGGGTKTIAALADLNGRILIQNKSGPSNPRNVGIKRAVLNIKEAIRPLLKKIKRERVLSTVIVLPAVQEEYKDKKKEILRLLKNQKGISKAFQGKVEILSDQIAAFKSGTNEKEGMVLISGTGCVAHGWRKNKEVKVSGWGYLGDEGSAFWVGQKVFQAILKDLDGRGPKTFLKKIAFRELRVKNEIEFLKRIYSENPTEIVPKLAIVCDKASQKGDKIAKEIMKEASKELVISSKIVIKKLNFQKEKFPLVLVGSMFKSKIVLDVIKKEIKKIAPKVHFIYLKKEPVIGAIKLARENLK